MQKLLTTKDFALAIGVSESSLRRWTNSGVIGTSRTPGGHRRIPLSEAIRFIREAHATVLKPEILGLEDVPNVFAAIRPDENASLLNQSLVDGDAARARGQLLSMYLGGMSVPAISDGPLCFAMQRIGELWNHDPQGILIEHRATDICIGALNSIRQLLPEPEPEASMALGGAPEGDPYILPSVLAAMVLADAGWRDFNFGPQTPLELLADAAIARKAKLVWLSISFIEDRDLLCDKIKKLDEQLGLSQILLVVGGRCAEEIVEAFFPKDRLMRSMADLNAFAKRSL